MLLPTSVASAVITERGTLAAGTQVRSVHVVGDFAYVGVSNFGLRIIDISDPSNPTEVGSFASTNALGLQKLGSYVYLCDGAAGLRVLNVFDPGNIVQTDLVDTPGSATNVAVFGNYAFVADGTSGVQA